MYKYICILDTASQKKLIKFLNKKGIFLSGDVYAKPLHETKIIRPYFKYSLVQAKFVQDIFVYQFILGLSKNKVHMICKLLLKILKTNEQKFI